MAKLEDLRKQARLLLRAARDGESGALTRLRASPRLADLFDDDLVYAVRLADARHAIALENGFASWPELEAGGRGREPAPDVAAKFLAAVRDGDGRGARRLLGRSPAPARTSFHAACALGLAETVAERLAAAPSLAAIPSSPGGWLPLLYVCASPFRDEGSAVGDGLLRCAEALLDRGADPNSATPATGEGSCARLPALYFAARDGDAPIVRLLLERGADPNDGESLYHAALQDRRDCLELLLEHGADLDGRGAPSEATPLYFLAGYSAAHPLAARAARGMSWLLEHGARPDAPSRSTGESPLHRIAAGGLDAEAAERLLTFGASPNLPRADGKTPYALAVRGGNADVAAVLLAGGADPTLLSAADRFLGACSSGDASAARRALAADPGIPDRLTEEERGIASVAAEHGSANALRVLAEMGFDLAREGTGAGTPLHAAAWHGRVEAVRALVELGVPIDARDREFGSSPLGWAAHGSAHCREADDDYLAIVERLIEAGATPEAATNRWGETPDALASRRVATRLRERGFAARRSRGTGARPA